MALESLTGHIKGPGNSRLGRMSFVLEGMIEEVADELNDIDPNDLERYFGVMAAIFTWMADGDFTKLPEDVKSLAMRMTGQEEAPIITGELSA